MFALHPHYFLTLLLSVIESTVTVFFSYDPDIGFTDREVNTRISHIILELFHHFLWNNSIQKGRGKLIMCLWFKLHAMSVHLNEPTQK